MTSSLRVCGEQSMGHLAHTFLFFKLLWSLPLNSNKGEGCVCVFRPIHTCAHPQNPLLVSVHSICSPSSSMAPNQGRVGVLSRVAGAGGGRAKAQVPAVADTGGETDEMGTGHCAQGSLLPVPWRTAAGGGALGGGGEGGQAGGYTAVHTVLTVNSASVAMMSVGWMLRSYIGFSNVARTFVFSWPA